MLKRVLHLEFHGIYLLEDHDMKGKHDQGLLVTGECKGLEEVS